MLIFEFVSYIFLLQSVLILLHRLFFGGFWPIRITSMRLIQETKNFEIVIGALYFLDMTVSGINVKDIEINKKWIGMIQHLFDSMLPNKEEIIGKYDNYIYSTFRCFVKQKRKMVFNMSNLWSCGSEDFRNLIMGELVKINTEADKSKVEEMVKDINDINLPRKQVLSTFHNVEQLVLELESHQSLYDGNNYVFIISLSSLLQIIKSYPLLQMVRIAWRPSWEYSMIHSLYSLSIDSEMKLKYDNAGYSIHLKERKGPHGKFYIHCVIKKKKVIYDKFIL